MCIRDSAGLDLDDAVGFEQAQGAGFVGGVIGHGNGTALFDIRQFFNLFGIHAQWLDMNFADGSEAQLFFLVHIVKVRCMLEKVGIELPVGQGHVGLHVVGKFLDDQIVTVLGEQGFGHKHDVLVREGRDADDDVLGGKRGSGHSQNHDQGQKQAFHDGSLCG